MIASRRHRGRACTLRTLAFGLCLAALIPSVRAQDQIVLRAAQRSSALIDEVLLRLQGELSAAGLEANVERDAEGAVDAERPALGAAQPASRADIDVREELDAAFTTLVLSVHSGARSATHVLRVRVERGEQSRGAALAAVQAVELLKAERTALQGTAPAAAGSASTVAIAQPEPSRSAVSPEEVVSPAASASEAPASSPRKRLGLSLALGATAWQSFDAGDMLISPLLRVGMNLLGETSHHPLRLDLRASALVLGSATTLRNEQGSARVQQQFATLDAVLRLAYHPVVQPMFSLGGGPYATRTQGAASEPYTAHDASTLALTTTLGTGLWIEPLPWLAAAFEAQLGVAWSRTAVRIADQQVGKTNAPMLLLSAQLVGML